MVAQVDYSLRWTTTCAGYRMSKLRLFVEISTVFQEIVNTEAQP